MSEMRAFLKSIHIENFRSLRKVDLPLKPLTVLAGPNASGKSNVLSALDHLNMLMFSGKLIPVEFLQNSLWADEASYIAFQLQAEVAETQAVYELELKAETNNPFPAEKLLVDGVTVISIQNG